MANSSLRENNAKNTKLTTKESVILLISVCVVGFCTIIYELLIGTVSSYFLGDSVKQFSLVIGLTMTAIGAGTLLSRTIVKNLIYNFIVIEILLAVIGGLSVPVLYFAYTVKELYYPAMCIMIFAIGCLIGLEIPLLTRIMESYYDLRNNISNVLSLDYLGAFFATMTFPFLLLPFLGVFETSLFAGFLNLTVAALNFYWFRDKLSVKKSLKLILASVLVFLFLALAFFMSPALMRFWERNVFADRVIFSKQTKYQKVVMTKNKDDIRMYIDGNIQFSSVDEHRYHELLVHIPMSLAAHMENILVLGGGDGMAVREILKYGGVRKITLVDLDKEITNFASQNAYMRKINQDSLLNPKVEIINADAFSFVQNSGKIYDIIISDLPDPNNTSLARLYSKEFYKIVRGKLSKQGVFVTQATSPFFSPEAYWCINETLKAAGYKHTYPYHVYVPSFGSWGFVMASNIKYDINNIKISAPAKYIDFETALKAFVIEKDTVRDDIKPSSMSDSVILRYYLAGWRHWN